MKRIYRIIIPLVAVFTTSLYAAPSLQSEDITHQLNYQGYLTDSEGNAITDTLETKLKGNFAVPLPPPAESVAHSDLRNTNKKAIIK